MEFYGVRLLLFTSVASYIEIKGLSVANMTDFRKYKSKMSNFLDFNTALFNICFKNKFTPQVSLRNTKIKCKVDRNLKLHCLKIKNGGTLINKFVQKLILLTML